ncbi:MerR family transcriptional regulator [Cytobacillus spongiae]|jgi:DNA-binding transcriptional MerR regulator/effector-binding domain-containing protein|uniref:MerR family transcriptional regulator n=1 Tax=Cytobacillus spongiae TaxID=2901381 RepID=UPI001F3A3C0B|nr:MerR family transcriptional regulator [Cytobacillus spongiae]UII55381.1 MerR family transcriptional regulator [Cytobacillus spongiae]
MKKFRVGEISKMFSIPHSTLRYYDEIDLFKPKFIDEENQYRYYTSDQFVHLDTIIFLRKIGFQIRDIQTHMDNRTIENTYDLFQKKWEDLQDEIKALTLSAQQIKHKMHTLKVGKEHSHEQIVEVKFFPNRPISFLYQSIPVDLSIHFEEIYIEEMNRETSNQLKDGIFTGDIGASIDLNCLYGDGPLMYKSIFKLIWNQHTSEEATFLPEGLYATYPHKGPYEELKESYRIFLKELKRLGYDPIGDPYEISIIDESVVKEKQNFITLIEIPVIKKL